MTPGFDIVESTAADLPKLQAVPTFIGWGGRDFVFDDHFLAEWKLRMPGATVRWRGSGMRPVASIRTVTSSIPESSVKP